VTKRPPSETYTRAVRVNSDLIRAIRLERGWTQQQLSHASDGVVRELARQEKEAGERGVFSRRVVRHDARPQLAGVSVATISAAERGKRIYLISAVILAKTLEVSLKELLSVD